MTIQEFAKLVDDMRSAQKHFFRTKSSAALDRAKAAESRVDKAVQDILKQPTLFDQDERNGS